MDSETVIKVIDALVGSIEPYGSTHIDNERIENLRVLLEVMDEYIAECERNCENWTESDWELSKQEYRKLLDEYKLNQDSYSQE